jgi:hypothetical protein
MSVAGAAFRPSMHRASLSFGGGAPLVFLVVLALLLGASAALLNDPDTMWHVAVGRWIVEHRALPVADEYSHTFAGQPWIAKEWLSQLAFFVAYSAAGWRGVVFLAAASIALACALLYGFLAKRMRWSAALAITALAALLCAPQFLARPHILVLPLIVTWMIALVTALERGDAPPIHTALLMALWGNMHGSFPLGLAMAGVLAGEGILHDRTSWRDGLRKWALFGIASTAAALASPYGLRALQVALFMSGSPETLRFIDEWQPTRFDTFGVLGIGALVAIVAVMGREARANAFRLIAIMLLAWLMIEHIRFRGLFAFVAPILAARSIGRLLPPDTADDANDRLRRFAIPLMVAGVAAILCFIAPQPRAAVAPDAALRAAQAQGISGPVYNDYDFGGFLIANGIMTFIDGRADQLFLGGFLPRLYAAVDATDDAGFTKILDSYGVTWALVRTGSRDAAHFIHMGWRPVFEDAAASVFARPR